MMSQGRLKNVNRRREGRPGGSYILQGTIMPMDETMPYTGLDGLKFELTVSERFGAGDIINYERKGKKILRIWK